MLYQTVVNHSFITAVLSTKIQPIMTCFFLQAVTLKVVLLERMNFICSRSTLSQADSFIVIHGTADFLKIIPVNVVNILLQKN